MDALYFIAVLLAVCATAQPMVEDASEASRDLTTVDASTVTVSPNSTAPLPPLVNCQTARAAAGACVVRRSCDYGTPNIDRTPYAPHGYISSCSVEQVCCPLDSIVASKTPIMRPTDDSDFDSDEELKYLTVI